MKLEMEIIDYFQPNFVEDDCIWKIVVLCNRKFVNKTGY
jgi:hypothetical protein